MLLSVKERHQHKRCKNKCSIEYPIKRKQKSEFVWYSLADIRQSDKLNFAGHSINDAQLSATERNKDWILDLASPQARATIRINSDLDEQGIEINANYLSLEKPAEARGDKSRLKAALS